MISSLKGRVEGMWGNSIEIEVGGVGYEVKVKDQSASGRIKIKIGDEVKLHIYMAVSENAVSLFGFETRDELELFKILITVSGVGPKTGIQVMGSGEALAIMKAIGDADVGFFQKIKGVGKKTAQRIIVDLKSKIGGLGEIDLGDKLPLIEDELYLSLKQLGFDRREIEKMMQKLPKEMTTLEEKISWCLREMG
ncbi:MAG: Holliday junction branch migration protein RuvA [Candidatus Shapirobacteria bacterium]|jgi:Holliday junction DNA helicase RuvA